MSGVISLARYKTLNADTTLSDAEIRQSLRIAQAIVEGITGLVFGSEVGAITNPAGDIRRLTVYGGLYEVGQSVRLIGGGVAPALFEISETGPDWIEVESAAAIAPTKVLPSFVCIAEAASGYMRVEQRPVFSVVSVKTKYSSDMLWSDPNVTVLSSTRYETFANSGLKSGVFIPASSIPRISEGGQYLVKRMQRQAVDGIRVEYVAGFYSQIPADLEGAVMSLVNPIAASMNGSGAFASENHDYYSYTVLTYDQLAVLPYAAMTILKRYARL